MKISAIQLEVVLGDREANLKKVEQRIEEAIAQKPDVIVLPELWDIGFFPKNALELGDVEGEIAA